jgi:hypothetical protein
VSGSSPVTTTMTIYTSNSACSSSSISGAGSGRRKFATAGVSAIRGVSHPGAPSAPEFAGGFTMAGLLLAGAFGSPFTRKKIGVSLLLIVLGLIVSGCGSTSSSSGTTSNAAAGSYSLTITGTDTSSSSITASTSLTLTID